MNLRGVKKIILFFVNIFFKSGNSPVMSFKHLRMINYASKCLKITHLKLLKFQNQKKN
jgi:hypothetical protein